MHPASARPSPLHSHARLLLIEDDRELANGLERALEQSGYAVDVAYQGQAGMSACKENEYHLIILDLGLPDMDGIEVLKRLRGMVAAPILILTARNSLGDRVLGLDAGGDDYLSKPAELSELEARVRALLRRGAPLGAVLEFAGLRYEPVSRHASVNGVDLDLTASEIVVLELLLRREGKVVSKSQFMDALYDHAEDINPSMIEVFISRLRRKLTTATSRIHIRSLRGLGYRIEEDSTGNGH